MGAGGGDWAERERDGGGKGDDKAEDKKSRVKSDPPVRVQWRRSQEGSSLEQYAHFAIL